MDPRISAGAAGLFAPLQQHLDRLEARLAEKDREIRSLQDDKEVLAGSRESARDETRTLRRETARLKESLDAKDVELKRLGQDNERLSEESRTYMNEMNKLKEQLHEAPRRQSSGSLQSVEIVEHQVVDAQGHRPGGEVPRNPQQSVKPFTPEPPNHRINFPAFQKCLHEEPKHWVDMQDGKCDPRRPHDNGHALRVFMRAYDVEKDKNAPPVEYRKAKACRRHQWEVSVVADLPNQPGGVSNGVHREEDGQMQTPRSPRRASDLGLEGGTSQLSLESPRRRHTAPTNAPTGPRDRGSAVEDSRIHPLQDTLPERARNVRGRYFNPADPRRGTLRMGASRKRSRSSSSSLAIARRQPSCTSCWAKGTWCDGSAQCRECKDANLRCIYKRCAGGLGCRSSACAYVHPEQVDDVKYKVEKGDLGVQYSEHADAAQAHKTNDVPRKAICVRCWETSSLCDFQGQCENCKMAGKQCTRLRCKAGAACGNPRCPCIHPGQWDEKDASWIVENGTLPFKKPGKPARGPGDHWRPGME